MFEVNDKLYASGEKVYVGSDEGENWTEAGTNQPTDVTRPLRLTVCGDDLFLGAQQGPGQGVYRLENFDGHWSKMGQVSGFVIGLKTIGNQFCFAVTGAEVPEFLRGTHLTHATSREDHGFIYRNESGDPEDPYVTWARLGGKFVMMDHFVSCGIHDSLYANVLIQEGNRRNVPSHSTRLRTSLQSPKMPYSRG